MKKAKVSASKALVDDVVAASRVLAQQGVLDAYGHVSARSDKRPDRFIMSRSRAPALVIAADVMEHDANSEPVGDERKGFLERFIHGEIFVQRPDVISVVHSHAATVVPFAASSVPLKPIYHMSSFLRTGAPVFEIREKFGMTDMLIRNNTQGAALAATLGNHSAVLLRGHGYCAVGGSIPEAVFRAYYAQLNADLQQRAIALGGRVTYLEDEEARQYDETNRSVIGRPWSLWKAKFAPKE